LVNLLTSVSLDGGTALQSPSAPQNNALNWLAGNTNLNTYSDKKKIQRYVLATLYYSTNGGDWENNSGWLTDNDECGWYNDAEGPFCADNSLVVELDLFGNNLKGVLPAELALLSNSLGRHHFKCIKASHLLTTYSVFCCIFADELTVSGNSLTGTIPSEIGLLSNLGKFVVA